MPTAGMISLALAMPASQNGAATINSTPTAAGLDAIRKLTRRMPMTNLRVSRVRTSAAPRRVEFKSRARPCPRGPSSGCGVGRLGTGVRDARRGAFVRAVSTKPCLRVPVSAGCPSLRLGPRGASVAPAREQPLQGLGIDGLRHVLVEPRVEGAPAVRLLAEARERDQQQTPLAEPLP